MVVVLVLGFVDALVVISTKSSEMALIVVSVISDSCIDFVELVVVSGIEVVTNLDFGIIVCLLRFKFLRLLLGTLFLLANFRRVERGTLFLNLLLSLDAPTCRLRTAGHDATNVRVVVLDVVVAVVDVYGETVMVTGTINGCSVCESRYSFSGRTPISKF